MAHYIAVQEAVEGARKKCALLREVLAERAKRKEAEEALVPVFSP